MKKKIFLPIFCFLLPAMPISVFANTECTEHIQTKLIANQTYGNRAGYKYKYINGKLCRRLWSYTHERWEDPEWTPL